MFYGYQNNLMSQLNLFKFFIKYLKGMFFLNKNENSHQLQTKFIRTNCMDCLDRTNNVQSFIGIEMLQYQLASLLSNSNDVGKFREAFRQMWILNGDCISKIYAGTGAIQGKSVTQDLSRSLTRAIQNNFLNLFNLLQFHNLL